jgi:hypothetical protein
MIARLFSHGVARLFTIVHRLTLQHGRKTETVKLRNKWVTVNPSEWKYRTDLKITVGLGTGSKEGMLMQLGQVFQAQMATLPIGVVQPQNIYKTLIEMAKAAGFSNAEAFFTDPQGKPPPQSPPDPSIQKAQIDAQSKQQLEQFNAQQDAAKLQATQQFDAQMLQAKQAFDKWKVEFDAAVQLQLEQIKSETQRSNAELSANTTMQTKQADMGLKQIEMQREDVRDERESESENDVKSTLQMISDAVSQLQQGASRKIAGVERIRDGSGRMTAVRRKFDNGDVEDIPIQ